MRNIAITLSLLLALACALQVPSALAATNTGPNFTGKWKLNLDLSDQPPVPAPLIGIVKENPQAERKDGEATRIETPPEFVSLSPSVEVLSIVHNDPEFTVSIETQQARVLTRRDSDNTSAATTPYQAARMVPSPHSGFGFSLTKKFYTDGRNSTIAEDNSMVARWDGDKIVVEIRQASNGKITETYGLSADGRQLIIATRIESGQPNQEPIITRRVYDAVDKK